MIFFWEGGYKGALVTLEHSCPTCPPHLPAGGPERTKRSEAAPISLFRSVNSAWQGRRRRKRGRDLSPQDPPTRSCSHSWPVERRRKKNKSWCTSPLSFLLPFLLSLWARVAPLFSPPLHAATPLLLFLCDASTRYSISPSVSSAFFSWCLVQLFSPLDVCVCMCVCLSVSLSMCEPLTILKERNTLSVVHLRVRTATSDMPVYHLSRFSFFWVIIIINDRHFWRFKRRASHD